MPTETLAQALELAYRTSPSVQASRYELRATDEDYALALSQLRPTAQLQITAGRDETVPGASTDERRPLVDRLQSTNVVDSRASAQLVVDQPLYTGGRAAAQREVALGAIGVGRARLRADEGDLFLQVVTAYADIRRDTRALALRGSNLRQLDATLAEVVARREAGELTRTDIAQAETQRDVARAQFNSAVEQLEQDRAAYAALVGRDPGTLAPEPPLPAIPSSIGEAIEIAGRLNPDLSEAMAAERTSRARIDASAAEGQPRLSLRGTATLSDRLNPLRAADADYGYSGQAVLTIPLANGGRVGALIAQSRDRNAADRVRIEAARRGVVQALVGAWNGVATAQRNVEVQTAQVASARILNEGTFEEYRAGLRSTFDVLFAQGSLRDAELALLASRRDLYVAQAALLRRMGLLEARTLLTGTALHDPSANLREAAGRASLPWDGAVRAIDRFDRRRPEQKGLVQPARSTAEPRVVSGPPAPLLPLATRSAGVPIGGTTGTPSPDRTDEP